MAYDPVPDLAALIDGVSGMARQAADESRRKLLGAILTGPYAALRGGLLLDEPAWDDPPGTEQALREALADFIAGGGVSR